MGKLSRSTRRKTMPVSAGAGTRRTNPCTPVWRPTPSTQDSLATVVWNIPHVYCSILLASTCLRCALLSMGYNLSSQAGTASRGNLATILSFDVSVYQNVSYSSVQGFLFVCWRVPTTGDAILKIRILKVAEVAKDK